MFDGCLYLLYGRPQGKSKARGTCHPWIKKNCKMLALTSKISKFCVGLKKTAIFLLVAIPEFLCYFIPLEIFLSTPMLFSYS